MGNLKTRITRAFGRRFSERRIGERTLMGRIVGWVTLKSLRKVLGEWLSKFFAMSQPAWLKTIRMVRYSPTKRLTFGDYLNPIYVFVWTAVFIGKWIVTRPYTSFGPALLAAVTMLFLIGLMVRQVVERLDWRGPQYQELLVSALNQQDDSAANICLVNLIARYPEKPEYRFQRAILLDKKGDANASREMRMLAQKHSFGGAALWLVSKEYDLEKISQWTPEHHLSFRQLSSVAINDRSKRFEMEGRTLFVQYLLRMGAVREATQQLAIVSERNPALALQTASLFLQTGDLENAKKYAQRARQFYEEQLLGSSDNKLARIGLSQALVMLSNEKQAETVLAEGYKLTQDPDFARAGGETLAAWAARIEREEGNTAQSLVRQIDLLKRAIELSPNNIVVLESLVHVAIKCADNKDNEVSKLRSGMLHGIAPESLHFIEGTIALLRNDAEAANLHLELAAKGNLQFPGVLNNLAVSLYQKDPPQLEKALAFADAAVKRVQHPYLYETRGQILVRLKRYQEAIPDLEEALKARELGVAVHESLAIAYEGLGKEELAKAHKLLASKAQATAEAKKPQ